MQGTIEDVETRITQAGKPFLRVRLKADGENEADWFSFFGPHDGIVPRARISYTTKLSPDGQFTNLQNVKVLGALPEAPIQTTLTQPTLERAIDSAMKRRDIARAVALKAAVEVVGDMTFPETDQMKALKAIAEELEQWLLRD